jgi:pilus assembly protein CpaB
MVKLAKVFAGLLVVVAIGLGAFAWMIARRPPPPVVVHIPPPGFSVVVASHSLPAGQPIKAEDLDVTRIGQSPAGSFSETASVVGRVPLADISAGQPVVDGALLEGLAGRLQPGERAVAIKVDELAGVGGRVRPGDWVDVFMLLRREGPEGEIGRTQARLLVSRVRVLAYGRADVTVTDTGTQVARTNAANANANANPAGGAAMPAQPRAQGPGVQNPPNAANDPMNAHSAVVAVPVDRIDALALADQSGRLFLALRNPADTQVADESAFAQAGTVLIPVNGAASLRGDGPDRAAAGLALDQLVRDRAAPRVANTPPLPAVTPAALHALTPVANRTTASPGDGQGIEVIRGTSRETVRW